MDTLPLYVEELDDIAQPVSDYVAGWIIGGAFAAGLVVGGIVALT